MTERINIKIKKSAMDINAVHFEFSNFVQRNYKVSKRPFWSYFKRILFKIFNGSRDAAFFRVKKSSIQTAFMDGNFKLMKQINIFN